MTEEEKELIKELERKSNLVATECEIFINRYELFTILNLIDYLQKENKKLEEKNTLIENTRIGYKILVEQLKTDKNKLKEENENAKWYIHQMIARINEDVLDYIDDDEEGNKDIIGELKETKKQWQDVEKLLNGESKDNLYNDWRKYGEYE